MQVHREAPLDDDGESPAPDAAAPAVRDITSVEEMDGGAWDQEMERMFFARGEAIDAGEPPEDNQEPDSWQSDWHDEGNVSGWFRRMTLPKVAALSVGVVLAGLWLLR